MKRLILSVMISALAVMGFAQTAPNRVLIWEKGNSEPKSYMTENVDSINFKSVEGEVEVELITDGFSGDSLKIMMLRSSSCQAFRIKTFPKIAADRYTDEMVRVHINGLSESECPFYFQDFMNGRLTDDTWKSQTDYTLFVLAYDQYATPCNVTRVDFTTPKKPFVGDQNVDINLVDDKGYEFTFHMTPSADVKRYYVMGTTAELFESQYKQFAPMFGWANKGDMIKQFSLKEQKPPFQSGFSSEADCYWSDMKQGETYTIYVLPTDVNGTYGDIITYEHTAKIQGDEGEAKVEIKLGKFILVDGFDENNNPIKVPTQYVSWTPNTSTSLYRFAVYVKADYDKNKDATIAHIKEDPCPLDIVEYYKPEPMDFYQNLTPGTEYIAVGIARNAVGEWGPVSELVFLGKDASEAEEQSRVLSVSKKQTKVTGIVAGKGVIGDLPVAKPTMTLLEK